MNGDNGAVTLQYIFTYMESHQPRPAPGSW